MSRLDFIMATLNISVDELLKCDRRFTLAEIIDGLKAYTKAAEIAAKSQGRVN